MFLLRWRYEWADRPAKYGMWNQPGEKPIDQAWSQNRSSILWAVIEAKNFHTKEIKDVVRCPGEDFLNFQWVASASAPGMGIVKGGFGSIVPMTKLVGLKLLTRSESISVFVDGKIHRAPLSPGESTTNFATFGR